jgi:hypothetical protein
VVTSVVDVPEELCDLNILTFIPLYGAQVVTSVVDVPEEVCDLNPTKLCRFTTRLVPSLTPDEQCTVVPKEGYYF